MESVPTQPVNFSLFGFGRLSARETSRKPPKFKNATFGPSARDMGHAEINRLRIRGSWSIHLSATVHLTNPQDGLRRMSRPCLHLRGTRNTRRLPRLTRNSSHAACETSASPRWRHTVSFVVEERNSELLKRLYTHTCASSYIDTDERSLHAVDL